MLACQFGAEVRLHKALTATQTHLQGLGQLSSFLADYELQKDENFVLSNAQKRFGSFCYQKRKLQKTNIPAGKTRGRVADGEDYWSKVDQWLKRLDDELGDNTAELKQSEFSLVFSMSYAKLVNRFIAECLEMDSLRTNKGLDFSSHPSERSFTSPSDVTSDPQPTTIQSFPSNSSSRLPEPHLNFGNAIAQLFSGPSTGRPF
ncbi:hypothetical protein JR316_0007966 [Psilocybe cubensis]|uniref:Uncharacterized protein n=1 Tax=Psilocybe cubensis TaxID=181762 RepID=A0ACB8GUR8_PSICU|nr:hypothetical protein JR316_0007966 [Psilocybe cubensis]KAH9479376.1 hypothetical protein JR316_0007966 [Psilocybe cubensis]